MGLAHLKTNHFLANAALSPPPFQCAVLAYNTLRWMALLSGNAELKRWEPQSIRRGILGTQYLFPNNPIHFHFI